MTTNDIKAKMTAAYEKYEKRVATTKKLNARVEKFWTQAVNKGYDRYVDSNSMICLGDISNEDIRRDAFDILCSWETAIDDVKSSKKKETELLNTYHNWVNKYNKSVMKDADTEKLPEIFKQLIEKLADEWTAYDIAKRGRLNEMQYDLCYNYSHDSEEQRKAYERAYRVYRAKFPEAEVRRLKQDDDKLHSDNTATAIDYVHDLIYRIKDRVGEITSLNNIHFSGIALNGIVDGTLGSVRLETIVAGGHNIQRLHYRVLVHNI